MLPRRGASAGRNQPCSADAVRRLELDLLVVQADLVGRQDQLVHRLEDHPGTTAERQREPAQHGQGADQKYQSSEVDHSAWAPAPSSSTRRSSSRAKLRPSA